MVSRYNIFIILRDATSTALRGEKQWKKVEWKDFVREKKLKRRNDCLFVGSMSLLYSRDNF